MKIEWTVKKVPAQPIEPERKYSATVDGLELTLNERHPVGLGIATAWTVKGFLADITVYAYAATNLLGYDVTVEQAKAAATAAAHRLYAVGVRGEKYEPSPYVRIEDGQDGRYAVGELSREGDAEPWKVVRVEAGAPVVAYSFALESDAIACRDELNGFPGPRQDPEVQPITGPTDAEEAALARADRERVNWASEGEEA